MHYGSEQPDNPALIIYFSRELMSERASEKMSEASIAEQANEWAVWANEQTDERVA